jgi:3',5'-cyclic AMP phosphodiesterase CpdA
MARIVVLSDIHLSPTHGFFWENWCVAREFADAARADAVVVNGDLAINGPDSDTEIAFAATALGNLRTRVMALPGNHDVGDEPPGQDPDQIIDADRLARWDSSFATDRWALDAGSWRLIGVNAQHGDRIEVDKRKMSWPKLLSLECQEAPMYVRHY